MKHHRHEEPSRRQTDGRGATSDHGVGGRDELIGRFETDGDVPRDRDLGLAIGDGEGELSARRATDSRAAPARRECELGRRVVKRCRWVWLLIAPNVDGGDGRVDGDVEGGGGGRGGLDGEEAELRTEGAECVSDGRAAADWALGWVVGGAPWFYLDAHASIQYSLAVLAAT